ncbi:helix-turn-helix domain-containing protein [Geothrix sp. PMB-07]|uniref:helix-turn-helix domain-containing protein n=1 Tax=Geothrix sp. PMB-07 TaxID=3068640 RepID=UPI00274125F7|nr:helix-turn-helix domain-containing protein [Geothrix sp. PMB-07]WLT30752.1 helix-turn-helix domain-containing protein [Geothrix sp. PMB-07]
MLPEKPSRKRVAYGLSANAKSVVETASSIQGLMADGINLDGSLKPAAIRALLKLKGQGIRVLAESNGYSDAYFHQVIERIRRDVDVEDILARCIGLEADRIWGRQSSNVA